MSEDAGRSGETRSFEAEVAKLLNLMVHSVYSNRDVFLRELISNAADACEKLRMLALDKPELLGDDTGFRITLIPDKHRRHADRRGQRRRHGPGRAHRQSRHHRPLGHARLPRQRRRATSSGTALIGQFGVGFYSAFMVAAEVDVVSRRVGSDEAWRWRSDGTGQPSRSSPRLSTRRRRAARGWC